MTIDASIPLQVKPVAIDPGAAAETAMKLRELADTTAMRGAYVFGPGGEVDRKGTLANLARINPRMAMQQSHDWQTGDIALNRDSLQNMEINRRIANDGAKRHKAAVADSLRQYYATLQQTGDEAQARQAGQGFLLQAGYKGAQFDPDQAHKVLELPDAEWDAYDSGGADAQPVADLQQAGGGMMPVASRAPAQPPQPQPMPEGAPPLEFGGMPDSTGKPGQRGSDYNWQKAYAFTRLMMPKANPLQLKTVLDYRTGQPITNEPVMQAAERAGKAGAANVYAAGGNIELGKVGANRVDEGVLDTTARLSRLKQIEQQYRPEYLQIGTRLGSTWNAIKEKAGVGLSEADRKGLEQFAQFKRGAIENLNQYIKEITGAAMSIPEAERIKIGMPNPGQGVFDGDSPTEFKAKLDDVTRSLKLAESRLTYIKRNGMSIQSVPLDRMPQLMNERGKALEAEVKGKYKSMTPDDVRKTVKRQLAQEFGLLGD
jgi:hypothetical protein